MRGLPCMLLIGVSVVLSACVPSHQEFLARDRQDCAGFGLQPGSPAYANCLLQLDAARQSHGYYNRHGY